MIDTIEHDLTPELLMAYAAGTLPEAFSLVVATHISMCDECRAALESYEAVGGCLIEDQTAAAMSKDSLAATLAKIAADPEMPAPEMTAECSVLPSPLQNYVGGTLDDVKWRSVGMGVKQAILKTSSDATARLLFIPAGCAMPDHGHQGTELTLVLQGAFIDENERFARGDVEVADEDLNHTPIADVGEDCICLTATDAPLRFSALMPRLAQRFLRI